MKAVLSPPLGFRPTRLRYRAGRRREVVGRKYGITRAAWCDRRDWRAVENYFDSLAVIEAVRRGEVHRIDAGSHVERLTNLPDPLDVGDLLPPAPVGCRM